MRKTVTELAKNPALRKELAEKTGKKVFRMDFKKVKAGEIMKRMFKKKQEVEKGKQSSMHVDHTLSKVYKVIKTEDKVEDPKELVRDPSKKGSLQQVFELMKSSRINQLERRLQTYTQRGVAFEKEPICPLS